MPLVLGIAVAAAPASAQDGTGQAIASRDAAPVTVTPYVSLGSPTSSRFGGAVSFLVAPRTSVEGEVGYRGGQVDVMSANLSLLYDLPRLGQVTPYLAAGIGMEEYVTAVGAPGAGVVVSRQTGLAVNAGGGIRVPIDNTWGLRTDARWFNGIGGQAPERWRVYNGVTLGTGRSSR